LNPLLFSSFRFEGTSQARFNQRSAGKISSSPRGEFEGTLIGGAGMNRLAVRDDHVFERKLQQGA
jgi:hypothetical protein